MQLLDGFSVTVGGENKTGGNRWILLMELHEKKKFFIEFFRQLASGTKWHVESFPEMNWSPCYPMQRLMDIKAVEFSRQYRQKCKEFSPSLAQLYSVCVCVCLLKGVISSVFSSLESNTGVQL